MAQRILQQGEYGPYLICGTVEIGNDVSIGPFTSLGLPKEQRLLDEGEGIVQAIACHPVRIGDSCLVGSGVTIHEGTEIGAHSVVEDHVRIGYGCHIGRCVRIMYSAFVCDRVSIADGARVAGFVCDGAQIGEQASSLGSLLHEYSQPHSGWWGVDEPAPTIERDAVIGYGARIIGDVVIGTHSYVTAGAIVTRNVPPGHVVRGTNELIPLDNWKGKRLKKLVRFWLERKNEQ